jgi:aspartate racemase
VRTIGILGGMGPEATVLLQQRLIAVVAARDDADHIPLIVDMNPQVPSRIARLIDGRGADPGPVLEAMARRLEKAGAQALAMACNTAHHYAGRVEEAVRIPFLDMVELSADRAAVVLGQGGKVGILASPAVRMIGLYDRALAARGLSALWPGDEAAMLAAIRAIKARGPCDEAREALGRAAGELAGAGAGLVLIACTEFSLIPEAAAGAGSEILDTLDVLVAAIRDFAQGGGA